MKKTFLKLFTVAVAAVMTATSFVGCGSGEGFAKDKYNIGVSGPLRGGAAVYGEAVKNGAELAIKEINAKLGDGDTKYAFEMKDDEATTKNIATNFSSLYEKGYAGFARLRNHGFLSRIQDLREREERILHYSFRNGRPGSRKRGQYVSDVLYRQQPGFCVGGMDETRQ